MGRRGPRRTSTRDLHSLHYWQASQAGTRAHCLLLGKFFYVGKFVVDEIPAHVPFTQNAAKHSQICFQIDGSTT